MNTPSMRNHARRSTHHVLHFRPPADPHHVTSHPTRQHSKRSHFDRVSNPEPKKLFLGTPQTYSPPLKCMPLPEHPRPLDQPMLASGCTSSVSQDTRQLNLLLLYIAVSWYVIGCVGCCLVVMFGNGKDSSSKVLAHSSIAHVR